MIPEERPEALLDEATVDWYDEEEEFMGVIGRTHNRRSSLAVTGTCLANLSKSVVISQMVKSDTGRRFTRMDADPEKNLRLSA